MNLRLIQWENGIAQNLCMCMYMCAHTQSSLSFGKVCYKFGIAFLLGKLLDF